MCAPRGAQIALRECPQGYPLWGMSARTPSGLPHERDGLSAGHGQVEPVEHGDGHPIIVHARGVRESNVLESDLADHLCSSEGR